jgi:hypothetical protein
MTVKNAPVLPGDDRSAGKRQALVRGQQVGLEVVHAAQPRAGRARALGTVEGEKLRREPGHGDAALGAGGERAEEALLAAHHGHGTRLLAVAQGQFHGVGQTLADLGLEHEPVHDQLDAVLLFLVQFGNIVQKHDFTVQAHPGEALALELGEEILVRPLLMLHQGGQEQELRALGQGHDLVHDAVRRLGLDGPAARRTMEAPQSGEEHPQEVIDLGDGAHGGTRVARGALLLQRDGRGEPLDLVHLGLVHLRQELPGVGRKGLHVPSLALGIDDVEGQGGLADPTGRRPPPSGRGECPGSDP